MIYCSHCGAAADSDAAFCANCGAVLGTNPSVLSSGGIAPRVAEPGKREETSRRVLAFLIDLVPLLLLSVLHFVPIIGWMVYGMLHGLWWLLRDVNGASLGKTILKSYVANSDGSPATTSARILRNLPLAIPGFLALIPIVGFVIEIFLAPVIFGIEAIALLATGNRLGDHLAKTSVFRR